jgi:peptidoglycan hydrolase CwlO-like protein
MENKINLLEDKINQLITRFKYLKEENVKLKQQLLEKNKLIEQYEQNQTAAINKLDNLIEVLKKEGVFEEIS